jgi:hypothetical protein
MAQTPALFKAESPQRIRRKVSLDFLTAAADFDRYIQAIRHIGPLFDSSFIQNMERDAADYLNLSYEMGLANSPHNNRFPGGEKGTRDTNRNQPIIEAHAPLFYLVGQIIAEARQLGGTPTLKQLFAKLDKEDWAKAVRATRVCSDRAHGHLERPTLPTPYLKEL